MASNIEVPDKASDPSQTAADVYSTDSFPIIFFFVTYLLVSPSSEPLLVF
eukprot:m.126371 g.126371  ORF g.126371 m.126371 type:complete len:50 (+) comp52234_c0_seq5:247-396(+)